MEKYIKKDDLLFGLEGSTKGAFWRTYFNPKRQHEIIYSWSIIPNMTFPWHMQTFIIVLITQTLFESVSERQLLQSCQSQLFAAIKRDVSRYKCFYKFVNFLENKNNIVEYFLKNVGSKYSL